MTGHEHYEAAEALLAMVEADPRDAHNSYLIELARIHALLAVAAAGGPS